jgi:type IV conjugative transfer system coupling protein TraD
MNKESSIKNYTRGGQITLHNIRMFLQITNKVTLIVGLIFILVTGSVSWSSVSAYERMVSAEYAWSTFIPFLNDQATTEFMQPDGEKVRVKYSDINQSSLVKNIIRNVSLKLIRAMLVGLVASLAAMTGITIWLRRRGERQTEDVRIKGDEFASKQMVKDSIIQKKMNSDLSLAGLPLIKGKETRHFFSHGTTGSGKSTAIKELLDQIRKRGDRAIIYDMSCSYLEELYLPQKDIILNPMDVRGESWHLWKECRDSADFDSLAAAQIPMPLSTQDPFWVNAARTIFSAAAFEMRNDPDRSTIKLLRYLLTADLEQMENYLKGTEAETLASRKTEKTAVSIKSVLATYLKSMKYIKDEENPFSIRQWIKNEEGNNWLFISSLDDRHETLKPLITAWLDIAVNALMSLPPSEDRRIWLILDELTSLHRLPYLRKTIAKGRKFGGCVVIGVQNFAELEEEYGNKGARSISSLLNSRYFFREPDPDMAKWSAENFGETIVEEVREGISYGANTMRDGISINRVETRKPLVNYSEIMTLDDLHAYVRLPGKFPVTSVAFQLKERAKRNEGLIPRKIDLSQLKEVDELIDKYGHAITATNKNESSQVSGKKANVKEKSKKIKNIQVDALDIT